MNFVKKYWINSNSGDIIINIDHNKYKLILVAKVLKDKYIPGEILDLKPIQFFSIKGFVPIKEKKVRKYVKNRKYGLTLKNGTKGDPEIIKIPTLIESRELIIDKLIFKT